MKALFRKKRFRTALLLAGYFFLNILSTSIYVNKVKRSSSHTQIDTKLYHLPSLNKERIKFGICAGIGESNAAEEVFALVKSIFLLSSHPVDIYIFSNYQGIIYMTSVMADATSFGLPHSIKFVDIKENVIFKWAEKINVNPFAHHSGIWGLTKIAIPWLLKNESRLIILDSDTIFLKDPYGLWLQFENDKMKNKQTYSSFPYRMNIGESRNEIWNMNSGVVLMDLERARSMQVYPVLMEAALRQFPIWLKNGVYNPPYGDQGIYYALNEYSKLIVGRIEEEWNREKCHQFHGSLGSKSKKSIGLLHFNCIHSKRKIRPTDVEIIYNFFHIYRWQWLVKKKPHGFNLRVDMLNLQNFIS